jgi:hypothetical protein
LGHNWRHRFCKLRRFEKTADARVSGTAAAMAEDLAEAEASAEVTPDFQAAMSGACTPLRPVPLASGQCLVPGTAQASTGMSWLTDFIVARSSSLAATVAITTAVIRFGMATLG